MLVVAELRLELGWWAVTAACDHDRLHRPGVRCGRCGETPPGQTLEGILDGVMESLTPQERALVEERQRGVTPDQMTTAEMIGVAAQLELSSLIATERGRILRRINDVHDEIIQCEHGRTGIPDVAIAAELAVRNAAVRAAVQLVLRALVDVVRDVR